MRIVDLCLDEQVDALLLAGDLYDGEQTSMKTARFLGDQVRRLHEAGVAVFVIRGNHDALSRITKELILPDSVKVFGGRAETVAVERPSGAFPVAIHGLSFAQPHAPDSLVGKYKPAVDGAANIGLLHTSLAGSTVHDPYAPCSVADLHATGFHYWALGHIHARSVSEAGATVVMPGIPQGRDINEAGAKSVNLVTICDDRTIRVEERVTSIAQFERIAVDVSGIEDWRGVVATLGAALERARAAIRSDHLVARVRLTGATPLAWRLRSDLDLMRTEADARAAVIGGCWIEKLEVACRPPGESAGHGAGDPIGELRRLIDEEIVASEAFRLEVSKIAEDLRGQLPPECRTLLGGDERAFAGAVARLVEEGSEDVLARLQAGAERMAA